MSSPVAAIVLAGGEARRLGGEDKALIKVAGHTMIDRVLLAVLNAGASPVVVVGPPRPIEMTDAIFTAEPSPGGGPVPAVAAGLILVGGAEVVLICPIDVPLIEGGDLSRLVLELERSPGVDVVTAADHLGRPNPLLAAYRRASLEAGLAGESALAGVAASELIRGAQVLTVDLGHGALNVNSPQDLAHARHLAGG